jgi:hypothetical protein
MRELVFFLEEQSAKEMLDGLLPRILDDSICYRAIHFEGKQDLEKRLHRKLKNWMNPDALFVVVRDQDQGDCAEVKQKLKTICRDAGRPDTLVRIACHELESWFLGDLQAVEKALDVKNIASKQGKKTFREPDLLANPKQELKRLTKDRYQQILGARRIGKELSITGNRSTSFNVFVSGVQKLIG